MIFYRLQIISTQFGNFLIDSSIFHLRLTLQSRNYGSPLRIAL